MVRHHTILLLTLLSMAVAISSSGQDAQGIDLRLGVSPSGIEFEERRVSLPCSEHEIVALFDRPFEVSDPPVDEHSNWVYSWADLGILAFSDAKTRQITAIEAMLDPDHIPPEWRMTAFAGVIKVDDADLSKNSGPSDAESAGFHHDEIWWEKNVGSMYVILSFDYRKRTAVSVEIGIE